MPDKPPERSRLHPRFNRSASVRELHKPRTPKYSELCTLSNFSFLRGASHPEELVEEAARLKYSAIGLADINSLAGVVRAHVAAKKAGIKLLIGTHLTPLTSIPEKPEFPADDVIPQEVLQRIAEPFLEPFSLVLYPQNKKAYSSLSRLLTLGKQRAPKGTAFLTLSDIISHSSEMLGLILLHKPFLPELAEKLSQLKNSWLEPDGLSLLLWNSYSTDGPAVDSQLQQLAQTTEIPLCATNNILYHDSHRGMLQDVLTCVRLRTDLEHLGYARTANRERYLKPPAELHRLFRKNREALHRATELAERINFSLSELHYEYPHEICPDGMTPQLYLRRETLLGAANRYPRGIPDTVQTQLEHEFQLIAELGYEKYFLTVYHIVNFARAQGILCQGRGAAANSAVCYCLGITSVDPSQVRLLVERFISKERNEPPDIDIDFEHERREEVIQHIYQTFGRHRAALVCEVITYRTRSALRDLGTAFGLSLDLIEELIKLVTRADGEPITREMIKQYGFDPEDTTIHHILYLLPILKGFPRHLSQHVGGFVIAEERLDEIVPIENAAMADRTVIEWDKDDIEVLKMLKIDVLALGMLTCIRKALDLVNAQHQTNFELHSIPADDKATYDMACLADTIGVFQIESRAQMNMLPRLKPRCFYDLVIEVAIVRPGPIQGGMVHPFLRRRAGKEPVSYPNDAVRRVLGPTLGVPIFQEQAMELVVVAAGFTPGEADELRRAMASWKRNKNMLAVFQERIISGMLKNGYSQDFAEQVFGQIRGFGEYGFPQSHAASFALLVYASLWLKCHHPAAFAAALINSQPMGFYQPAQIITDAQRHGVTVNPVDVNYSSWDCTLEGTNRLRLGMCLVRSLSQESAECISRLVKAYGPYSSLKKLWRDANIPARDFRTLARADAFRSLGLSRQQALWEIKLFHDEPLPLFANLKEKTDLVPLPPRSPLQDVADDYIHSATSLRAHPLAFLRRTLEERGAFTARYLVANAARLNGRYVFFAGMVLVRQRPGTASGIVFMTLEDETGMANLVIFPDIFRRYRAPLCDGIFLFVRAKVQHAEGITHLAVESAENLGWYGEIPELARNFH